MSFKVIYNPKKNNYKIKVKGQKIALIKDKSMALEFAAYLLEKEKSGKNISFIETIPEQLKKVLGIKIEGKNLVEVISDIIDSGEVIISVRTRDTFTHKKSCFIIESGILFNYNSMKKIIGSLNMGRLMDNDLSSDNPILVQNKESGLLHRYFHKSDQTITPNGFIVRKEALGIDQNIKDSKLVFLC